MGRWLWLVLSAGCAGSEPPGDVPRTDAPFVCDGALLVGHCRSATSGEPCRGAADEAPEFATASDGAVLPPVIGPQGARMLVIAVRVRGIEPGDPGRPTAPENPVLRVSLTDPRGIEVATYLGRGAFVEDPTAPTWLVRPAVFVITEEDARGRLAAVAVVRDPSGVEHCGELTLDVP
jgi:hypothetical protein